MRKQFLYCNEAYYVYLIRSTLALVRVQQRQQCQSKSFFGGPSKDVNLKVISHSETVRYGCHYLTVISHLFAAITLGHLLYQSSVTRHLKHKKPPEP